MSAPDSTGSDNRYDRGVRGAPDCRIRREVGWCDLGLVIIPPPLGQPDVCD